MRRRSRLPGRIRQRPADTAPNAPRRARPSRTTNVVTVLFLVFAAVGIFGPDLVGWNHSTRVGRLSIVSELPTGLALVGQEFECSSRSRRFDLSGYKVSGWCDLYHQGEQPIDITGIRIVVLGSGEELLACKLAGLPDSFPPGRRLRGTFSWGTDRSLERADRVVLRLGE